MGAGRVDELYQRLKEMAVNFQFKPGERINEVALAADLEASRTPLREALNRLVAEQFFVFRPGRGFFCRELDSPSVFALYEARGILETATARLACARATDEDVQLLKEGALAASDQYLGKSIITVTRDDEAFHIAVAQLTGNGELVRQLHNINERIRFVRWIDMSERVVATKDEHKRIVSAIERREAELAASLMQAHIAKRMDQIVAVVKEGYSNIFLTDHDSIFERPIELSEV
ncbi:MAG: GntR family transcriptional regulator [Hyphomicrobiales bacterium]|nr:GntR family transcriptional regulator [Hyphomicrobiales bacterium]